MSDVLLIQNTRIEGSGYLGELLSDDGFDITSIHAKHETIPEKKFSLVVILGAPESANDNLPYLIREQKLIKNSVDNDSFSNGLLKGPAYTRPEVFEDLEVPKVLLSGNHSKIEAWKATKSLIQTHLRRPDLINKVKLSKKQKKLLEDWESKDIL